jgi:major membrane immunogen (membrane-anchored lipoprotein)
MKKSNWIFLASILLSAILLMNCNKKGCKEKHQTSTTYVIQDSLLIAISQEWQQQNYEIDQISIKNLNDIGFEFDGTISGTTFSIPSQDIDDDNWKKVECTGTITGNNIVIDYTFLNWDGEPFWGRGSGTKK